MARGDLTTATATTHVTTESRLSRAPRRGVTTLWGQESPTECVCCWRGSELMSESHDSRALKKRKRQFKESSSFFFFFFFLSRERKGGEGKMFFFDFDRLCFLPLFRPSAFRKFLFLFSKHTKQARTLIECKCS